MNINKVVCFTGSRCYNVRTLLQLHLYMILLYSYSSVIAGQTMVWVIFHLLPINMKFQGAILSQFNIAISVVNGPFFYLNESMAHGLTPAITLLFTLLLISVHQVK